MLIKQKDPIDVTELQNLLKENLTPRQKFLVERELLTLKAGERGEKDSAYFIDFHYKDSKNFAIIHDLRLEHNGNVAQIDHLLINRTSIIYVLESKSFSTAVKITNQSEFLALYNKQYYSIESPVEQNTRHIELLDNFLKEKRIFPSRLGFTITPSFKSYILISPKSRVIREDKGKFDSLVIKADSIRSAIIENVDNTSNLSILKMAGKILSTDDIIGIAENLAYLHKPKKIDYAAKFGINLKETPEPTVPSPEPQKSPDIKQSASKYFCSKCKEPISMKAAQFCWNNKERFKGKAFCFNCQKTIK